MPTQRSKQDSQPRVSIQYEYCRKIFQKQKNVKIIQADFTKTDIFQYSVDCYFFNDTFKKKFEFIEFIGKVTNFSLNKKKNFIYIC